MDGLPITKDKAILKCSSTPVYVQYKFATLLPTTHKVPPLKKFFYYTKHILHYISTLWL
jgi:hypothetical protein